MHGEALYHGLCNCVAVADFDVYMHGPHQEWNF